MTTVTKQQCTAITADIKKAVGTILAKHGLEFSKLSAQYGDMFGISIKAVAVQKDKKTGVNMKSPEVSLYLKYGYHAFQYGQLKAKIGTAFKHDGYTFVFAGIRGGSGRQQIVCLDKATGTKYFFGDSVIPIINQASKKGGKK